MSIEIHSRDVSGIKLAFMPKHDLARTNKAGLVVEKLLEPIVKAVEECEQFGPRSHERHVAAQDVPELR